jgi:hypothetical protein
MAKRGFALSLNGRPWAGAAHFRLIRAQFPTVVAQISAADGGGWSCGPLQRDRWCDFCPTEHAWAGVRHLLYPSVAVLILLPVILSAFAMTGRWSENRLAPGISAMNSCVRGNQ